VKLDKADLRILAALQRDARISMVDLASEVGLTPTPCTRRVRQLEEAGLIEAYTAILEPRKVGHTIQAIVQIKLERHTDEIAERFRRTLQERPEVMSCYVLTGDTDFLLHVVVRDIDALSDFTMRRLLRIPGVRDVRSSIVIETVKRSWQLPLADLQG
jgi:Lrp/AsnC family leucine-responsive transcriptional regulator